LIKDTWRASFSKRAAGLVATMVDAMLWGAFTLGVRVQCVGNDLSRWAWQARAKRRAR
jgi:hypothetical protein